MKDVKVAVAKPHKYPATLSLDSDDLPAIAKWNVGGKYTITLEVEQVSASKGDEYGPMETSSEGNKRLSARFKVLSAKAAGYEDKDPMPARSKALGVLKEKAKAAD